MRLLVFTALGVVGSLVVTTAVRADECDAGQVLSSVPASYEDLDEPRLAVVPTNAMLFARYTANSEYDGEFVRFKPEGGETVSLDATYDAVESLLRIEPPPLTPGVQYRVIWPGLRGVSGPRGRDYVVDFLVGVGPDNDTPEFEGIGTLDWEWTRDSDDCTDGQEDRYSFKIGPGAFIDQGGADALSLLVFQTEGPGIDGDPVLVHIGAMPAADQTVSVPLTPSQGLGRICFSTLVRDSSMRISNAQLNPLCVETTTLPYFGGCSLAEARRQGAGGFLLFWVLALCLPFVRRR